MQPQPDRSRDSDSILSQYRVMIKQERETKEHAPHSSTLIFVLDRLIFTDLLATVVCAPLAYGTVEAWSIALFELNALLLAVLLAGKLALETEGKFRFHRVMLPLTTLVLLGVIQTVPFKSTTPSPAAPENIPLAQLGPPTLSVDPAATREATVKVLALAVYFFVAVDALGRRGRRQVTFNVITTLGFALAVFAIIQRLTWNGRIYWVRPIAPELLAFGPFVNPNHFAGMMELILPLAFAYLLFARVDAERRALWFFAAVMMAVSVVLSLSRGGMLALGVELLAFVVVAVSRGRWDAGRGPQLLATRGALAPIAVSAIAIIALWVGYDQVAARWRVIGQGRSELSVAKRLEVWRDCWQMFREHPVWGVGLGAFPTAYPSYGRSSAQRERLEQAHNDYLQLLTDGGLIGGVIGLWFLVELIIAARRQWRELAGAGSLEQSLTAGGYVAALGLMVHSFTDFNLQITSNALLFLLVIALATPLDSASLAQSTPQKNDPGPQSR